MGTKQNCQSSLHAAAKCVTKVYLVPETTSTYCCGEISNIYICKNTMSNSIILCAVYDCGVCWVVVECSPSVGLMHNWCWWQSPAQNTDTTAASSISNVHKSLLETFPIYTVFIGPSAWLAPHSFARHRIRLHQNQTYNRCLSRPWLFIFSSSRLLATMLLFS